MMSPGAIRGALAAGSLALLALTIAAADPRSNDRPPPRVVSEAEADDIIAVAEQVSQEMAASLRSARQRDPEAFRSALGQSGRKLTSLATLRRLRPALFEVRVEELRLENQAHEIGTALKQAVSSNDAAQMRSLETQLAAVAQRLVDQNLRARALELSELDQAVKSMRLELEADAKARGETAAAFVAAYRNGQAPPVLGGRTPVAATAAASPAK